MADTHPPKRRRSLALALMAGSCTALATHPAPGAALGSGARATQPAVANQGASFDQIDFPIAPLAGEITLRARAGWVWREGATHRILLKSDVDVTIAGRRFLAKGASLWLRQRSTDPDRGTSQYQIYAIFEDLRSADATITMQAQRLPVRGVIETSDPISMTLDARFDSPPTGGTDAAQLLARTDTLFAQRVLGATPQHAQAPAPRPWSSTPPTTAGQPAPGAATDGQAQGAAPGEQPPRGPIFEPDGVFSLAIGGRIVIDGANSGSTSVITADGGVTIQYQAPSSGRWVDFRAERVVIYTRPGGAVTGVSSFGTSQIEGIYLEGGVFAGDDQWSVRSPRMYLDVVNNRALMLDTVFWTVDKQTAMPLYVRADTVRQTASDEFRASKARISNTPFFAPDVTLGINDIRVTLKDQPASGGDDSLDRRPAVEVEARGVTLRAGPVPLLWLPGFKGDPSDFPLRQIQVGSSNRSGMALRTRWNALSLLRIDAPPGVKADLDLDFYAERGLGLGLTSSWHTREHRGGLFSYLLPDDLGTDIMASGKEIERDGDIRGIFAINDIWEFTNQWTLVSELSYISDEAFVPALFEDLGRTTEAYRNRLQLERRSDDKYFALELSTTIDDFIVPEHQLQSPGYRVNKLPEARFVSLSRDLLPDYQPGLLTYAFEARAGRLNLSFSEPSAAQYGFTTDSLADRAFGTLASESLGDKMRAMGLDEDAVTRLDTRHELTARLDLGPVRVTPFLVGRATAYDSSFDEFSPDQGDNTRFWGAGGVTLSTTVSKINNDIESRFFDVHRLRHIIEPSVTLWGGDSNFQDDDLPVFDNDIEGLLTGTAFRAAVDQTWQTKRGGVGRWRDVDLVKLRTEYVWTSDRAGQSAIPDYFSSRPELSNPGEYFGASMIVQPTEVLALAGEWVYDLEADRTAKSSIGAILEHRPGFTTSIEYREVRPLDATFATLGAKYRLSDKYAVNVNASYNFDLDDFQSFNTQILRRFQVGTLGLSIHYNNIRSETSIGFIFRALGSGDELTSDPSWGG